MLHPQVSAVRTDPRKSLIVLEKQRRNHSIELELGSNSINVIADWYADNSNPSRVSHDKAIYLVESGRAVVLDSKTIKMVWKDQPSLIPLPPYTLYEASELSNKLREVGVYFGNEHKPSSLISIDEALAWVDEGRALVVSPSSIRTFLTKKEVRRYILERDNYTCHYCGNYGDTVEHKKPETCGGFLTPGNCVCACDVCNNTLGQVLGWIKSGELGVKTLEGERFTRVLKHINVYDQYLVRN